MLMCGVRVPGGGVGGHAACVCKGMHMCMHAYAGALPCVRHPCSAQHVLPTCCSMYRGGASVVAQLHMPAVDNQPVYHPLPLTACYALLQAKWHPMIIKWCIHILYKSGKAGYEAVSHGGFITLPSHRTLLRYMHKVHQKEGVHQEHLDQVAESLESFLVQHPVCSPEREVAIVFDALHIQSGLFWDSSSGELVGFADEESLAAGGSRLAEQMCTFMVRNISGRGWSAPIAFASYSRATPQRLYRLLCDVIFAVHSLGLRTAAVICDGAEENRALIKLCATNYALSWGDRPEEVPAEGLYMMSPIPPCTDKIWLLVDYVHCFKNWRNLLYESKVRQSGRCLLAPPALCDPTQQVQDWGYVLWEHVVQVYEKAQGACVADFSDWRIPKEAIELNSWRKMRVVLAAKVLSSRMARGLTAEGSLHTAGFCSIWNELFDLCNEARRSCHSSEASGTARCTCS